MERVDVLKGLPDGRLSIGGDRCDGEERLAVEDPSTGEVLLEVACGGRTEVDAAVQAASAALHLGRWPELGPRDRGHLLLRLAGLVKEHAEELAGLESLDVGKPLKESLFGDLPLIVDTLVYFGGLADKIEGRTISTRAGGLTYTLPEPVGVVGAIVPWNFPLLMAVWKLAPALAAGCTIILKPAEQTPLCALKLPELFAEAGFPKGVFNVVPGRGEVAGRALVEHPDVSKIAFTGSTDVGREIMQRAAQGLKRLSLELGGKSPLLIFDDAGPLEKIAARAARAVFFNQGECCTAASRLLVSKDIYQEFTARLVEASNAVHVGAPFDRRTDMGPLISAPHRERVLGFIERGRQAGARLLAGGGPAAVVDHDGGYFVRPTILDDVDNDEEISREEVFGPVACLQAFESEEEALSLANATAYGLAAGVWTGDGSRAHRVAGKLRVGTVWVNSYDRFDPAVPFGGVKASGFGRENGQIALGEYLQTKAVWVPGR